MVARTLALIALVLALRLPFLNQPIQGDDVYYLYGAEHAQIDPLHPTHARYVFLGDTVDMRGHSHGPLNSWILAGLLMVFKDIREVPFHLAYTMFSLAAVLAMWSLARRFSQKPFLATLLFCVVPAFVVNGNSLEADLPFLAFWMLAAALFVFAAGHKSGLAVLGAAAAGALAGLAAYQAVFLTPILAVYLLEKHRGWIPGWFAVFAAPAGLAGWQLFERMSGGALPASMLAGYLSSYHFTALVRSARGAAALLVHLGWVISPVIVIAALRAGTLATWIAAALASAAGTLYDPNPLFWISLGLGVWWVAWCVQRGFLRWWVLLFLVPAMLVFFAGSARYLLPIAAPLAILAANTVSSRVLIAGFGAQLALGVALATVNYQHWDAYRKFAREFTLPDDPQRTWINGEWGLRFYLESEGALPYVKGQTIQPGDRVVSNALANPPGVGLPMAPLSEAVITSPIPLRLISLNGKSAYSVASLGLLPFEISRAPIDRIRAEIAIQPRLSYLHPRDSSQVVSGLYPDGWTARDATVLLKVPDAPARLEASIFIPPNAPARHVSMSVNGATVAEKDFAGPGGYTLTATDRPAGIASVKLSVDKTFSAPGDQRSLGVVVVGIGYR